MKKLSAFFIGLCLLLAWWQASCAAPQTQPMPAALSTDISQADMPDPVFTFCVEQGHTYEIRTSDNGSECDEWAYFRGECGPTVPTPEAQGICALRSAFPMLAPNGSD